MHCIPLQKEFQYKISTHFNRVLINQCKPLILLGLRNYKFFIKCFDFTIDPCCRQNTFHKYQKNPMSGSDRPLKV